MSDEAFVAVALPTRLIIYSFGVRIPAGNKQLASVLTRRFLHLRRATLCYARRQNIDGANGARFWSAGTCHRFVIAITFATVRFAGHKVSTVRGSGGSDDPDTVLRLTRTTLPGLARRLSDQDIMRRYRMTVLSLRSRFFI